MKTEMASGGQSFGIVPLQVLNSLRKDTVSTTTGEFFEMLGIRYSRVNKSFPIRRNVPSWLFTGLAPSCPLGLSSNAASTEVPILTTFPNVDFPVHPLVALFTP